MNNVLLASKQNKNCADIEDLKTKYMYITDYITSLVQKYDNLQIALNSVMNSNQDLKCNNDLNNLNDSSDKLNELNNKLNELNNKLNELDNKYNDLYKKYNELLNNENNIVEENNNDNELNEE